MNHKPHTPVCRGRIQKAMEDDELAAQRIKDASGRQDSWLERRVEESDVRKSVKIDRRGYAIDEKQDEPNDAKDAKVDQDMHDPTSAVDKSLADEDFHKQVDMDFEERMNGIPDESDMMHDEVIGVLRAHVAEVYSPPRVTLRAKRFGLLPGFSMDLETSDEDGNAWNFDIP